MQFRGDEFNLYRALRSINPSPYLFYFDYGDFKIIGSSPEAQLQIKNGTASLFPIAGTYRRRSDAQADLIACQELLADQKENAEHVMLVDLARNDLSRSCKNVHVEKFKEIKLYSHVIHLRSTVSATLGANVDAVDLIADTFPMGTVTGAPKFRAMELIDRVERGTRGIYGGALGYFGFDGNSKHTLVIRSFLSSRNHLHFQAGAGIVARSNPATEVEEVNLKLGALRDAIKLAREI
jgi:anthranilate synthase component 1